MHTQTYIIAYTFICKKYTYIYIYVLIYTNTCTIKRWATEGSHISVILKSYIMNQFNDLQITDQTLSVSLIHTHVHKRTNAHTHTHTHFLSWIIYA